MPRYVSEKLLVDHARHITVLHELLVSLCDWHQQELLTFGCPCLNPCKLCLPPLNFASFIVNRHVLEFLDQRAVSDAVPVAENKL